MIELDSFSLVSLSLLGLCTALFRNTTCPSIIDPAFAFFYYILFWGWGVESLQWFPAAKRALF